MSRSAVLHTSVCLLTLALVAPARAQDDTRDVAPPANEVSPDAPTLTEEGEEIIERTPSNAPGAGLGVEGIPERTGDDRRFVGRIRTEFAEVMAGPGAAYIGRGRVYQNDRVQILRRNDAGDWLEVEINGLRGWVRARYLEIQRGAEVRGAGGALDAGRDRRRTNYGYDDRGRRLRPDGTPFGSGEGTDGVPGTSSDEVPDEVPGTSSDEVPAEVPGTSSRLRLAPYAALGLGQVRRAFDSDIAKPSPLAHQTAQPSGMSVVLGLDWDPLKYLRLGARFDGSFFGSTDIPRNPALGFERPVTLAISGWRAGLDALGRYPVGQAWIGAYGGLRLFRQNFQETAGYPLFLTSTLWSAALGGAAGVTFGPGLELTGRGGYCVPLSISQSPADSGDLESGGGYELGLGVGWRLSRRFTALMDVYFARHRLEFAGASSQKQAFDDEETAGKDPVGYEHARETDTLQGAGLGIRVAL
ncbi:SH3 domain-containing protein [Myxococcota bacterium]|nr:SH3 domain-containing protein [Myxococcota bacterium]